MSSTEPVIPAQNYMQRVGKSFCVRCDFETDGEASFEQQDAAMMAHLTEKHPDWMTDGWPKNPLAVANERIARLTADLAAANLRVEGLIRDNRASAAEVVELRGNFRRARGEAAKYLCIEQEISRRLKVENAALKARVEQLTNPITLTETLTHSLTCSAGYDLDADCICGLDYRIQLQTEQNLHAAWMKRAMETEARVEQLSGPVTDDEWQLFASLDRDDDSRIAEKSDVDALIRARNERSSQ